MHICQILYVIISFTYLYFTSVFNLCASTFKRKILCILVHCIYLLTPLTLVVYTILSHAFFFMANRHNWIIAKRQRQRHLNPSHDL